MTSGWIIQRKNWVKYKCELGLERVGKIQSDRKEWKMCLCTAQKRVKIQR